MKTVQVFVSHTSDMARYPYGRSFVQAALDAIGRAEMAPVDMRYFPAQDRPPADYCRARIRGCGAYVAVIGYRYGSIVPGEAVSYTEMEFQEAGLVGLPRLIFLLEDGACPAWLADADRSAVSGFRQRLCDSELLVRGFNSTVGLELEVFHALSHLTRHRRSALSTAPAGTLTLALTHLIAVLLTQTHLAPRRWHFLTRWATRRTRRTHRHVRRRDAP